MFATADLIDEHEAILQSCDLQFRDFGGQARFHGPIRTVVCREDNVLVRGGNLLLDNRIKEVKITMRSTAA
jgi:regulator of RNase E activity RraA